MLDFRVYTFLAVCECMNYTRAAEALHITQPAVSQHIRYLEKLYQAKLFWSEGKKIRLTPAGKRLFRAATAVKNDDEFLKRQMLGEEGCERSFRFGITRTIGESVIAAPLARYIRRHPEDQFSMIISNTDQLRSMLDAGSIQFALIEGFYEDSEYESMTCRTEAFVPVCAASHHFAEEPASLKDLLRERLLIREPGSGTRNILEKTLEAKNMHLSDFSHLTEIGSMHVILQLLEMDVGLTFLYRTAVREGLHNGIVRELKLRDFQMEHDFTFIWNKGSIYGDVYRTICGELL